MLKFDIITIFPKIFDSYLKETFIKKSQDKKLIKINIHNLRDYTKDKHKKVDEKPFGGGLGMVMKVEPVFNAVKKIKKGNKTKVILFTPRGKQFDQKIAFELSKCNQLIMICGRYEGVDERVAKHISDIQLSIGQYDLMGGELPAMILMESITRLIPGAIGKDKFLKERITENKGFMEYPQYTRPEVFEPKKGIKWRVPKELISGNHKEIEKWREKRGKEI
jgi:tRNA (guanine37-N1)-methyltransferase